MVVEEELRQIALPEELIPYIGEYHAALLKRAEENLVGESEFRCFKRFLDLYGCGKYKFAFKAMDRMFEYLSLLIHINDDGKPERLTLYPIQRFIMCAIFGLRRQEGGYLVNTANIYIARRNGKSFLLSSVLHYLMGMSKFRKELIILASCKGENATICFNEFANFIDNDRFLRETYDNVNRTSYWAKNKYTGNRLEMFRTGGGAKKTLDGFTNRVAIIDEEMLCDEIITKTIQDGQAHYKDSLLVTMSTAQFSIGSDNHKKWMTSRKMLYENTLPDETFLLLCEPDPADIDGKDYTSLKYFGKANPVLLYEKDGATVKSYIKKKYVAKAKEAALKRGFSLQSFVTKQCNVWYSAEDKNLCTYEQMKANAVEFGFEDVVKAGYKDWYLGIDLSQTLDLTSVCFETYIGVDADNKLVEAGGCAERYILFLHWMSWMPQRRLQGHVENDQFPYRDYIDKELFLCSGAGGENIDSQEVLDKIIQIQNKFDLHFVTIASDPYGIAGIQSSLADICDTFILQNQSPKAMSQYIEIMSGLWKDRAVCYQAGHEDIFEKAMTNAVMVKNQTGYFSIEKVTLRADSNIRIDPMDAMLTGFIAPYIDFNTRAISSDEAVDDWLSMMR